MAVIPRDGPAPFPLLPTLYFSHMRPRDLTASHWLRSVEDAELRPLVEIAIEDLRAGDAAMQRTRSVALRELTRIQHRVLLDALLDRIACTADLESSRRLLLDQHQGPPRQPDRFTGREHGRGSEE